MARSPQLRWRPAAGSGNLPSYMILSHSHRFIFVHIPKTGGLSVRTLLTPYNWDQGANPAGPGRLADPETGEHLAGFFYHLHAAQVRERILPEYWAYYKFSFTRNPFDLAVSLYKHVGQSRWARRYRPRLAEQARALSFEDWVRKRADLLGRNRLSPFVCDAEGLLIVDRVGRFECLREDFAEITTHLGLGDLTLPHQNATQREPYRGYYAPSTRDFVAEIFAEDLERFSYAF